MHSRLSAPLNRNPELYNQYYFNGDRLTNASLDYGLWFGGLHFFGETAMSDNGAVSTLNGLLAGLDRHVTAAVLFRSYARDYQALTPNAFGESSWLITKPGFIPVWRSRHPTVGRYRFTRISGLTHGFVTTSIALLQGLNILAGSPIRSSAD